MRDRHALHCDDLTHDYRPAGAPPRRALDYVDLRVATGTVHGLLGPNGAGKTTLVRIVSTLLVPTAGSATVMGHDVVADIKVVRRTIGLVLGGERGLYNRVSAEENLRYWPVSSGFHAQKAAGASPNCSKSSGSWSADATG